MTLLNVVYRDGLKYDGEICGGDSMSYNLTENTVRAETELAARTRDERTENEVFMVE